MWNKFFFALYALNNYIKKEIKKHNDINNKTKEVLIIIDRVAVGDVVTLMEGLYNLSRYMNSDSGYNVHLATDCSVIRLLKACHSSFDFSMISISSTMQQKYYRTSYKKNYENLNIKSWDLIISIDPLERYLRLMLMGLQYKKIIAGEVLSHKTWSVKIIDKLFLNYDGINCCGTQKKMAHKASNSRAVISEVIRTEFQMKDEIVFYRYRIPLQHNNVPIKNMYCCVCAGDIAKGHANPYRAWDVDKYIDVLRYILQFTNLDIVFVGSDNDKRNNDKLFAMLNCNERVKNMTCQTTFDGWMELLGNAKFVLGNDSGGIHLSYLLGTQAFVITGYYDYGRFHPYEKEDMDDIVPIDIRVPKPDCALCAWGGEKDRHCDMTVKTKGRYKCIDDISAKDVIAAIDDWLIKNNLKTK